MFILSRSGLLENCKDNIYRVQDGEIEEQYLGAGYYQHERSYKIKEQHKEYSVICIEFRNDTEGAEPVVVVPEFFIHRRPYPVYVYLYAIDLYSREPEKGQRWAAAETRKQFGLETFAHTTLGRALKTFVHNIEGGMMPEPMDADDDVKPSALPAVQATWPLRKQAARFLQGRIAGTTERRQSVDAGCALARDWFREYRRFLL